MTYQSEGSQPSAYLASSDRAQPPILLGNMGGAKAKLQSSAAAGVIQGTIPVRPMVDETSSMVTVRNTFISVVDLEDNQKASPFMRKISSCDAILQQVDAEEDHLGSPRSSSLQTTYLRNRHVSALAPVEQEPFQKKPPPAGTHHFSMASTPAAPPRTHEVQDVKPEQQETTQKLLARAAKKGKCHGVAITAAPIEPDFQHFLQPNQAPRKLRNDAATAEKQAQSVGPASIAALAKGAGESIVIVPASPSAASTMASSRSLVESPSSWSSAGFTVALPPSNAFAVDLSRVLVDNPARASQLPVNQSQVKSNTTFMITGVSTAYTQETFLDDLVAAGFGPPRIDFLYLPFHFGNRMNQGYAFINFTVELVAGTFVGSYASRPFGRHGSQIKAVLADRQGAEANIERLRRKCSKIANPRYRPLVLQDGELLPMLACVPAK